MTDLIPEYRRMAAGGQQFRGLSIVQHKDQIGQLVRKHRAESLLDYGCGAGDAYKQPHRLHKAWGLRWFQVTLYDPAFEHDEKPAGLFDGVLCSDVLEHIPQEQLDGFVKTLYSHARIFLWASVCCRPAKKCFPDGTNLHVTVQPFDWWQQLLSRHAPADRQVELVLVETP